MVGTIPGEERRVWLVAHIFDSCIETLVPAGWAVPEQPVPVQPVWSWWEM